MAGESVPMATSNRCAFLQIPYRVNGDTGDERHKGPVYPHASYACICSAHCKHVHACLMPLWPLLLLLLTRPVLNFLMAYTRFLSCLLVARYTTPYVPSPILPSRS
jgi:hypothetical protein